MSKRCSSVHAAQNGSRLVAGALAGLCLLNVLAPGPAEAWHRRHHHFRHHGHHRHLHFGFHLRHLRPGSSTTQFAALVVDGNTGRALYGRDETALRHPASITKVMTLYLLFEQLDKGRLHLDSRIPISAHAAAQAPTKIGLRPGQTIDVDDAIKAIVTQSANDIAVAVAEAIGGSEDRFAEMMTAKAHALGMNQTHYANASGLPNDEQLTTAHDLAILGRAVQERFPRYYRYFSTRSFVYRGVPYHNHNHLLGRIEGVDGIKTGYTRASGFNLMTSVKRDGHFIIAVVLGGASSASRDRLMDSLIEDHIADSSTRRTVPVIAEAAVEKEQDRAASTPMPIERPRPAVVSAAPKPAVEARADEDTDIKPLAFDGTTGHATAITATPSSLRWVVGAQPVRQHEGDGRVVKAETVREASRSAPDATGAIADEDHARPAHSGWMIQIGATDDEAQASELLARAKARGLGALVAAKPFTEKVQKGSETLYRARFAGLEADSAEAACKSLKRSGFACFATKN